MKTVRYSALIVILDILLHQSGHIMLSDFDLAKQSNDPSGLPVMVQSEQDGVSSQKGYLAKRC